MGRSAAGGWRGADAERRGLPVYDPVAALRHWERLLDPLRQTFS